MSHHVVSLFSGVGGFDLGFEQAGFETAYQCEIDARCRSVLRRHFPNADQWGDITTLTGEHIVRTLAARNKTPDVIIWGSPCQDLSVAGKGAGLAGARSGLFYEGIRIINEIRKATNNEYPRVSVWENVAGALSSNGGADFGQVIDTLAEAGSVVIEWRLLDAQYFGVPQRRRRVFVISLFDPDAAERCAEPLLPVTEGVRRDTAQSTAQGEETARSTDESTGSTGSGDGTIVIDRAMFNQGQNALYQGIVSDVPISPTLTARGPHAVLTAQPVLSFDSAFGSYAGVFENHTPPLKGTQCPPAVTQPQPIVFENSYRDGARIADGVSQTLQAHMGTGGLNTPMVAQPASVSIHQDKSQATLMREREGKAGGGKGLLYSPEMSLSLLTANEQRLWIETEETTVLRKLMPIECERLMGWSDGWTEHGDDGVPIADTHRYAMCGNGVASPVARWIAEQLSRVM